MKRAALLLVISHSISSSYAAQTNLEEHYLRQLNQARSISEVTSLQLNFEQIRILRLACRMQVNASRVPVSCFEALHLETHWGLHTHSQAQALEQELNERCRRAAAGLRLPPASSETSALSKSCAHEVEEARQIEKYRDRDADTWSGN